MSSIAVKRGFVNFSSNSTLRLLAGLTGVVGSGALAYEYFNNNSNSNNNGNNFKKAILTAGSGALLHIAETPQGKGFSDYQDVYNAIAEKVREEDDADDGAGRYGLLCRLAWHSSGTFDKSTRKGGSYGGTMIYAPEANDGENAGLQTGRDFLAEFGYQFPWISRGDLWTLGGVVAVQEAGGPKIKWRPGRKNLSEKVDVPENGNLPDASQDGAYVKKVFSRLGFDDRETVALIGAHCLGKCHTYNSGYDGPWGPSPNMFTNDFFVRLLQGWHVKEWDGKKQWEDDETKSFMMLPTDYALKENKNFLKYVKMYAEDEQLFFSDFSKAFTKLLENGINFPKEIKHWEFKTLDEQEEDA